MTSILQISDGSIAKFFRAAVSAVAGILNQAEHTEVKDALSSINRTVASSMVQIDSTAVAEPKVNSNIITIEQALQKGGSEQLETLWNIESNQILFKNLGDRAYDLALGHQIPKQFMKRVRFLKETVGLNHSNPNTFRKAILAKTTPDQVHTDEYGQQADAAVESDAEAIEMLKPVTIIPNWEDALNYWDRYFVANNQFPAPKAQPTTTIANSITSDSVINNLMDYLKKLYKNDQLPNLSTLGQALNALNAQINKETAGLIKIPLEYDKRFIDRTIEDVQGKGNEIKDHGEYLWQLLRCLALRPSKVLLINLSGSTADQRTQFISTLKQTYCLFAGLNQNLITNEGSGFVSKVFYNSLKEECNKELKEKAPIILQLLNEAFAEQFK